MDSDGLHRLNKKTWMKKMDSFPSLTKSILSSKKETPASPNTYSLLKLALRGQNKRRLLSSAALTLYNL